MGGWPLDPQWTVEELLERFPQAARVFVRFRMACVGCPMASFDSLEVAARTYGVPWAAFAAELAAAIGPASS
ncbi:MAG: DUF1858 domain-containing protein [Thermoanaerobaculum sp.]